MRQVLLLAKESLAFSFSVLGILLENQYRFYNSFKFCHFSSFLLSYFYKKFSGNLEKKLEEYCK